MMYYYFNSYQQMASNLVETRGFGRIEPEEMNLFLRNQNCQLLPEEEGGQYPSSYVASMNRHSLNVYLPFKILTTRHKRRALFYEIVTPQIAAIRPTYWDVMDKTSNRVIDKMEELDQFIEASPHIHELVKIYYRLLRRPQREINASVTDYSKYYSGISAELERMFGPNLLAWTPDPQLSSEPPTPK